MQRSWREDADSEERGPWAGLAAGGLAPEARGSPASLPFSSLLGPRSFVKPFRKSLEGARNHPTLMLLEARPHDRGFCLFAPTHSVRLGMILEKVVCVGLWLYLEALPLTGLAQTQLWFLLSENTACCWGSIFSRIRQI